MSSDDQRVAERPRVAFITGAAGGIGRGIAEHLAGLGYSIGLSDISESALQAVAEDSTETTGVAVSVFAADLADRESVQAAVDATVSRLGGGVRSAALGPRRQAASRASETSRIERRMRRRS